MTFFLTLGSILAIALYGVIGAFYVEMLKGDDENVRARLNILACAGTALAFLTGACFKAAHVAMKRSKDQP